MKNADGSYRVALNTENGENVTDTIVVNGKVHISGLDKVNYWLDETRAPDGYNKLTERQEVKLSEVLRTPLWKLVPPPGPRAMAV